MSCTYAVYFTHTDLPPSEFVAASYVVDDTNTLAIFRDEDGKEVRAFPFALVREIETRGYGVSLASSSSRPQLGADLAVARAADAGGMRPTPPRQPIESVAAAAAAGGPRG